MQKRHVTHVVRFALALALTLGLAGRASAASIALTNVHVQLDLATLVVSITGGLQAHSDDGSDVFLDGLSVSLAEDGVDIPDLFAGPTLLDDLPFFGLPASLPDGGSLPDTSLLFRLTGLKPNADYTGTFYIFQFSPLGFPEALEAPQTFSFRTVPEPATLLLTMIGASGGLLLSRRRRWPGPAPR
jgi:hypothetical protein